MYLQRKEVAPGIGPAVRLFHVALRYLAWARQRMPSLLEFAFFFVTFDTNCLQKTQIPIMSKNPLLWTIIIQN